MSKYAVEITESAENDLREIGYYIANELLEPDIARKVIDKIAKTIIKLEELPLRNAVVNDKKLALQGIRKIMMDNYIIFYIITEENKTVTIVRILCGKRDWINFL